MCQFHSFIARDVGSISNLGGHDASRALVPLEKGALSRNKKGSSLFIAKSWGAHAPSAPGSYVYVYSGKGCPQS